MVVPRSWAPLIVESTDLSHRSALCRLFRPEALAWLGLTPPSEVKWRCSSSRVCRRANSASRSRHGSRSGIATDAFNNLPMPRNGRHRSPFELAAEVRSGTNDHHLRSQMRFRTSSKTSICPVCRYWCADPHKHGDSTFWIASTDSIDNATTWNPV